MTYVQNGALIKSRLRGTGHPLQGGPYAPDCVLLLRNETGRKKHGKDITGKTEKQKGTQRR